jgi:hypothetical protein
MEFMNTVSLSEISQETGLRTSAALLSLEQADPVEMNRAIISMPADAKEQWRLVDAVPGKSFQPGCVVRLRPKRLVVPLTRWGVTSWNPQIDKV